MISSHYDSVRQKLLASPRVWLVTGAAGFIGSNLVEDLLSLGQTVIGLDNFSTGHRSNIEEAMSANPDAALRARIIDGDIRNLDTCRAACEGVDYVLHHAALGSVPWSMDDPIRTNSVNVVGFVNMLMAAKDAGVRRFVYASSSAVYGDTTDNPQVEERVGRPLSPYAASKAVNETYATAFEMSYGLKTVGLRYFNVFGKRQDPAGAYAAVIPRWISTLLRGDRCRVFGDGQTTRDFCYVANVIQANILSATVNDHDVTAHAYNVATAESVTLNELFYMMRDNLSPYRPAIINAEPRHDDFRAGDVRFSCASIEKARLKLGFSPSHGVADGLKEAVAWYVARAESQEFTTPSSLVSS